MNDYWEGRGQPWEFDAGPPRNRCWPRLFAETPNYRALGKATAGREMFRWHFGPMFYRGRLGDDAVRVLVIGQEGAQDESLSHRSFTGGTGARMQHFLKHLGITKSYLFLNTFVYPIFGQYGDEIQELAQHVASPVALHRHAILDYVLARNELHLVVAVGTAAKESVVTWVEAHGGRCPDGSWDLSSCESEVLGAKVRCLGVRHPGGAASGGVASIIADFKRAIGQAELWAEQDPDWLPVDPGGRRLPAADFKYASAPIPFFDLPLGVPWRLGRGGTSSNRRDDQRSIQIFSAGGRYNGSASYGSALPGTDDGYGQAVGDLPYEPPRRRYRDYDRGPSPSWARLLMGGRSGFEWPDFAELGVTAHESLGWGPMYRGRPNESTVLVLADQRSQDDLFLCRASTGNPGQHLQAFLEAIGLTESYMILRVLPVDTMDLDPSKRADIVAHPQVRKVYREICRQVAEDSPDLAFALAVGTSARGLAPEALPADLPRIEIPAHGLPGWRDGWIAAQSAIENLSYEKDVTPTFAWGGERRQIPRQDLPYGTLRWQGSSGERAQRGKVDGLPSPHYYKLTMPLWAFELEPEPL